MVAGCGGCCQTAAEEPTQYSESGRREVERRCTGAGERARVCTACHHRHHSSSSTWTVRDSVVEKLHNLALSHYVMYYVIRQPFLPVNSVGNIGLPSWILTCTELSRHWRLFVLVSFYTVLFLATCARLTWSHSAFESTLNFSKYLSNFHPSRVDKWVPATCRDKGVRITSVGWQVTLCDPIWQVISRAH